MATTQLTGEPYTLAGQRMAFTSWYYVRTGSFGWYDRAGSAGSLTSVLPVDEGIYQAVDRPRGVRLLARHAVPTRPVATPEQPYERMVLLTTIIQNEGRYQAWGSCATPDGAVLPAYFESRDGRRWERPALGIVEHAGSRANNLVEPFRGAVFIDPSGPPEERYKAVGETYFPPEPYAAYTHRRPNDVDPQAFRNEMGDRGAFAGVGGAVSPDGLHWTAIVEPLVVMHADSPMACYYDQKRKTYVGYFREWMVGERAEYALPDDGGPQRAYRSWFKVGRRAIGRAETDDFRNFPLSELILEPRLDMRPSQVLYTNCRTTFPGAPDQHLMFPAVWDMGDDTTTIDLATSHDGKVWNWAPGTPLLETATAGAWDGGCVFAYPNLIELVGGDFALPFTGYLVPHKYPRGLNQYATGYALWPKGRLIAIDAPEYGEFATVAVIPPGQRLLVNAVTKRAVSLLLEAAHLDGSPVAGRTFADARPLVGDCYRTPVVWEGGDTLGLVPGEPLILRFRMDRASIYFVEFA